MSSVDIYYRPGEVRQPQADKQRCLSVETALDWLEHHRDDFLIESIWIGETEVYRHTGDAYEDINEFLEVYDA